MDNLEVIFIESQPEETINLDSQPDSVDLSLIFEIKTQNYLERNWDPINEIKWDDDSEDDDLMISSQYIFEEYVGEDSMTETPFVLPDDDHIFDLVDDQDCGERDRLRDLLRDEDDAELIAALERTEAGFK
ncbi:uncharacterized protein LOC121405407 [Drosophila obscura]|uniref:uncharacterized protein LOC121405407 n=1 Tax=Drosophila obscura TaxID=7282 RepID=UPI001BB1D0D8|nr:uncharacterized protein LOC121405407 [Drosophila obscura]